jgi:hypothetical protein
LKWTAAVTSIVPGSGSSDVLDGTSPYDPRLRLAADLYSLGLINGFASADGATVEIRNGGYELPFGRVYVAFDPSALEWHDRRIVALTPVDELEIRGLI